MESFTKIMPNDPPIIMFAKMQIAGRGTGREKHDYVAAIEKHAAEIYGKEMGSARSFAKAITEDEIGKLLYRALKAAPGLEIKSAPSSASGDAMQDFVGKPAHLKLHSMAVDHQRAHSGMTYAQAYSHLYSRPENEALRNQIKSEHMAATMAQIHG